MRRLGRVDWSTFSPGPVIGVDEVGRGCLAGPVVAAAVILNAPTKKRKFRDSKQLSADRRDEFYDLITSAHRWAVGFASVEEIDRVNIYHASLIAMRRAVNGLREAGGHVLVDGKARIPYLRGCEQTTLIGGDARCEPVSAASIVAKVTRDRFMTDLARRFPDYGFEIHKGYATRAHRSALARVGPCPYHRRSFSWDAPVEDELAGLVDPAVLTPDVAGRRAELLCLEVLNARGWRELLHDVKCAGVQVDLIGRAPSGTLTLIEVKMNTAWDLARISQSQFARLKRAAALLAVVEPVQMAVALIENHKVRLLPVDALTGF